MSHQHFLLSLLAVWLLYMDELLSHPLPIEYGTRYYFSGVYEPESPQGHIQYMSIPYMSEHCKQTMVAYFHMKCIYEQPGVQSWRGFGYFQGGAEVDHIWKKRLPVQPQCASKDVFKPIVKNVATGESYHFDVHYGDSYEGPFTPLIFLGKFPATDSVYEFYTHENATFYGLLQSDCYNSTSTVGPIQYVVLHSYPPYFKDTDLLINSLRSHMEYHLKLGFSKYVLNMYPKFVRTLMGVPFYKQLYDNGTLVFGYHHPLPMTGEFFPAMFQMNQALYTNLVLMEYWGTNTMLFHVDLDDYAMLHTTNSVQEMHEKCFPGAQSIITHSGWTFLIGNDVSENAEWKNSSSALRKYLYKTSARSVKAKVLTHPDCTMSLRVHSPTVFHDGRCRVRSSAGCLQRAHLENMFSNRAHVPPQSISYAGEWFAKVVGSNKDVGFVFTNVTSLASNNTQRRLRQALL